MRALRLPAWQLFLAIAMAGTPLPGSPFASARAMAQTDAAKPTLRIAPLIVAEPEVETGLSIQVGQDSNLPRQTFVRIRGLPQTARLSDGHVVSPGTWAVPLTALPTLKLTAPLSSSGRSELILTLVTVDGSVLNETRTALVVAPAWLLGSSGKQAQAAPQSDPAPSPPQTKKEPPAEPQVAPPAQPAATPAKASAVKPAPPAPAPPPAASPPPREAPAVVAALPPPAPVARQPLQNAPLPPSPPPAANTSPTKAPPISAENRARAEALIQRGDTFMAQGNVAAARQFFRRAADMGHGLGAMRLAASFDPFELSATRIVGLNPDPKQATAWYERARELGVGDATRNLTRLQNRR